MTLTTLLVTLLVIFVVGLVAYWIISKFFEGQPRTVALMIVGAILLIILLAVFFPGVGSYQVWK